MTKEEQIKVECWNKSFHALGTSYVFAQKSEDYKRGLRIITVLVLVVPLLIGGTVMAYGKDWTYLNYLIGITAPVVILHLVLAIISLIYKWDDQLAYSLESQTDNKLIAEQFENLAKFPPTGINELEKRFEVIRAKDNARSAQDDKNPFSAKENRMGMRYALWIRQKECATCKQIPLSMTPTKCLTCGKF